MSVTGNPKIGARKRGPKPKIEGARLDALLIFMGSPGSTIPEAAALFKVSERTISYALARAKKAAAQKRKAAEKEKANGHGGKA